MNESHWRLRARKVIQKAQKEADAAGMDEKQRKRHISQAYPFGERENHPYKMWLKEVAFQTKVQKSEAFRREIRDLPGQGHMFGEEA